MNLGRCFAAELVGTFTLTFIGAGAIINGQAGLVGVALAHGLALAMAVYATGHISGGHINPAVTIAMLTRGRIAPPAAVAYIVAQLLGALLAAAALSALFPGANEAAADGPGPRLGATLGSLSSGDNAITVLVIEAILTFLLVTTIFGVAVDDRKPSNVYGFAIGLTVAFDILCAGPLTGASMNPARSFGPALVGGHWDIHWVYWVGPIVGAIVAAQVYDLVHIGKKNGS